MVLKVLLVACSILALTKVDGAAINETKYVTGPDGSALPLVNLGGTDYYFETNLMLNWYAASDFCRRLGLFLVSVETQEENTLIRNHILQSGAGGHYWTSGSDFASHGQYVWASTGARVTFSDWSSGEPNHDGSGTNHERIIHYYGVKNYKWNDKPPYFAQYFICENITS